MDVYHGPIVNLNGASRKSLIAAHVAVVEAADALHKALAAAYPHGRDYQTAGDNLHATDMAVASRQLREVASIRGIHGRIAERLATEAE